MNRYSNKVGFLDQPSPLEFLPNLSKLYGSRIYVKRDDQGGRGGGGNKLRKYERIIADAIRNNADTLIIAGHLQSNASRQLVGVACQLGLKSIVVCKPLIPEQNPSFNQNGNALLMELMDAHIMDIPKDADYMVEMNRVAADVRGKGGMPYIIPFGGSNYLGAMGYVDCANEILEQYKMLEGGEPDYIAVTAGSGGTMAGLIAGLHMAKSRTHVLGVSVLHKDNTIADIVTRIAGEVLTKVDVAYDKLDFTLDTSYVGAGYGLPSDAGKEAVRLLARTEALFLCPVYTGKAMSGLLDYITANKIRRDESVVFVHTGGYPLVHAYYNEYTSTS